MGDSPAGDSPGGSFSSSSTGGAGEPGDVTTGAERGPGPPVVMARTAIASARDPSRPSSLSPVARPAKKHELEPDPSPSSTFRSEPHGDDAARRTRSSSASTTDIGGSTAGNRRGSHCVHVTWYPTGPSVSSASSPAASSGGSQSIAM